MIRKFSILHHTVTGDETRQAALGAIASAHALTIVEIRAGAGKLGLLALARQALSEDGCEVIGCALTGKGAESLQSATGIPASPIALLIGQIELHRNPLRLSERTAVVVDEPWVIGFDDVSRLIAHVAQAQGRIVLIGEPAGVRA